jgi:hypothetical protein
MRFIISAQRSMNAKPTDAEAPFDEALFTAYMRFNEEMYKAGVLVAAEGLNPGGAGARLELVNGKRTLVDAPFAESKELVGGFYIVDVKSRDEAIAWALRSPTGLGTDDVLEVRALTGVGDLPPPICDLIKAAAPTLSAELWKLK